MSFGISTCWWKDTALRTGQVFDEVLKLGLEGVELEYRISEATFRQMESRWKRRVAVLSIHNFFPKPEAVRDRKGGGDLFLLSSSDRDERALALRYSLKTIEHAERLAARTVVLHLGRVEMPDPTQHLMMLYQRGAIHSPEGRKFMTTQKRLRRKKALTCLDRVLQNLDRLSEEAVQRGIRLGIENRYHFHEIPSFEEIGEILKRFRGGPVGYWHDVGHAAVQEILGISRQKDLLEAYEKEVIGIHLHDVRGTEDHYAPGQGEVDLQKIAPYLSGGLVKILEVHPKAGEEGLIRGIHYAKSTLEASELSGSGTDHGGRQ